MVNSTDRGVARLLTTVARHDTGRRQKETKAAMAAYQVQRLMLSAQDWRLATEQSWLCVAFLFAVIQRPG